MTSIDGLAIDPPIHHRTPVLCPTRLPATTVVGSLAGGMTFEEVQREYDLTAQQIRAALAGALELTRTKGHVKQTLKSTVPGACTFTIELRPIARSNTIGAGGITYADY